MESVYFAVRTDSLYKAKNVLSLKGSCWSSSATRFSSTNNHHDITAPSLKHKHTNNSTVMPDDGSLNRNMWLWMTNIKVLFLAAILHWYAA
jgi:hypothetical protein